MSNQDWYLRLSQEILGPLSEAELRDLAQRGGLLPDTPVSQDRTRWTTAASVEGLVFPPPPPPPQASPDQRPAVAATRPGPGWFLAGMALGALGLLGCGGLLWVILAGVLEPPAAEEPVSATPTRQEILAEGTVRYWQALRGAVAEDPTKTSTDSEAMVTTVRQMAAQIRAIPTSAVDPDAVQCGLDVACALNDVADQVEANNSPAVLVEAFLRGLVGDPFGKGAEMLDAQSALQGKCRQVQTNLDNTRAILSSRYGVEFPPIQ
jgi:hypothetical protein